MRFITALIYLTILLTGCANNDQPASDSYNSVTGVMGEVVREASGYGLVTKISAEERIITIKHAPIPEMNWPPMLMAFNLANDIDLLAFKRQDKVEFILEIDAKDRYKISKLVLMTEKQ